MFESLGLTLPEPRHITTGDEEFGLKSMTVEVQEPGKDL